MKYIIRITATFLVIFLFAQVIQHIRLNYIDKISAPENNKVPVAGTWKASDYKIVNASEDDIQKLKLMVEKEAGFTDKKAVVGDVSCEDPKYTLKNIKTEESLYGKSTLSEIGITGNSMEVVSVLSGEKLFFDMILISDNKLAVIYTGGLVLMDKISDTVSEANTSDDKINASTLKIAESEDKSIKPSGVLLGVKTTIKPEDNNGIPAYRYRTLWIGMQNNSMLPIKEVENLLVPRITGFWKVDIERISQGGEVYDKISSYPLDNSKKTIVPNTANSINSKSIQNITFVGNDFISMEYGIVDANNKIPLNNLKVVPLNNTEQGSIKIGDIFGDKAKDVLTNSAKSYLQSINFSSDRISRYTPGENDFAMFRKNGHWILRGRLFVDSQGQANSILDYNINLMPEKKLVNYDNLTISWKDVKEIIPNATDIFESPNSDFAIAVSSNSLSIHQIKNNILSSASIARIEIGENDSIIMSEWATGDYTEIWDRTAASFGKVIQK